MSATDDERTNQLDDSEGPAPGVILRDGTTVRVRPVAESDQTALLEFYRALSPESRRFRFFSAGVNLDAVVEALGAGKEPERCGLVAVAGPIPSIVAHAVYRRTEPTVAEVGFAVADDLQGLGLGTVLLGQLAQVASRNGISVFEAVVLASNHQMVDMLRQSGFSIDVHPSQDGLIVRFPTSLTGVPLDCFDRREQLATATSLRRFFAPQSVAVIGASRQRGTVGGEVFHNLIAGAFNGPVYPVNPHAEAVQAVMAYRSVLDIPGAVDLAVVVVPCDQVIDVIQECGEKGIRAVVVLSAGFAEAGTEGRLRQEELLRAIRARGMRLIGPNCLGILNTDPGVQLNATFGPTAPAQGRVGFMSQSGALGLAAMDYARSIGVGISSFASVGNKADISGNDLLCYWESDPRTEVILLYLESFGNPRKFSRIARRVARQKPIVALKSGRSLSGAKAAGSHTGALLAASDATVDALFHQTGVIRVDTIEELFGVASLLESQPLPSGHRVGIVTNVGGPAILCADACESHGLQVPALSEETRKKIRECVSPLAATGNPIDMIASATPAQYRAVIPLVAADPSVDAIIAIFVQPLATRPEEVAAAIAEAGRAMPADKPLLAVFMSGADVSALEAGPRRVPWYAFPESAAIALGHAAQYAEWRRQPVSTAPELIGLRQDEAAAIVAKAMRIGPEWLMPDDVRALLDCYGIPCVPQKTAHTPLEAATVAETMDGPWVLKGIAAGVVHKSDVGLVRTELRSTLEVLEAAQCMQRAAKDRAIDLEGFLVQPMASGVEMLAGIVHEPLFGPVVACGAGGVLVELMKDVAVRLAPLSTRDADTMVQSLRSYPLLTGYRGAAPADVAALEDILLRLSALAEALPEVAELDCNPIMVGEHGAVVVDARVRIAPAPRTLPDATR